MVNTGGGGELFGGEGGQGLSCSKRFSRFSCALK